MKKESLLISILMMLPILCIAQWKADMINSTQGNIQEYKVHSDGDKYRYDFTSDDMNGAVIVKPDENLTAILLPNEFMVHYTPSDGMMSRMNDPVQAYGSYLQYGTETIAGEEMINGYLCTKKVVIRDEKPMVSQWFSEKLNFPVKMVVDYTENTYMELRNISPWDPDPSVFVVPEGFVEVDSEMRPVIPEPEPPAEWEETAVTVPVDMPVSRGMLIIVPIAETVYHKLIVENTGDTPMKFIFQMFKNGVELPEDEQGPAEYRTHRLYMEEKYNTTHNWKAGQVIRIKVYEGEANLKLYKE